jgi:uncharacterized RDD family membrane protein YckC
MEAGTAGNTRPVASSESELGRRIGAGFVDLLFCGGIFALFLVAFGESEHRGATFSIEVSGAPALGLFAAWFTYYFIQEWQFGTTLGKRLFGLRVIGEDGGAPTAKAAAIRTALRAIDGLFFYLVAVIAVAVNQDDQRLGDQAANTRVVRA